MFRFSFCSDITILSLYQKSDIRHSDIPTFRHSDIPTYHPTQKKAITIIHGNYTIYTRGAQLRTMLLCVVTTESYHSATRGESAAISHRPQECAVRHADPSPLQQVKGGQISGISCHQPASNSALLPKTFFNVQYYCCIICCIHVMLGLCLVCRQVCFGFL